MYNDGFQPWYPDRQRYNLRSSSSREYAATEEGLATVNTMINANQKYLWTSALTYCTLAYICYCFHPLTPTSLIDKITIMLLVDFSILARL